MYMDGIFSPHSPEKKEKREKKKEALCHQQFNFFWPKFIVGNQLNFYTWKERPLSDLAEK